MSFNSDFFAVVTMFMETLFSHSIIVAHMLSNFTTSQYIIIFTTIDGECESEQEDADSCAENQSDGEDEEDEESDSEEDEYR